MRVRERYLGVESKRKGGGHAVDGEKHWFSALSRHFIIIQLIYRLKQLFILELFITILSKGNI